MTTRSVCRRKIAWSDRTEAQKAARRTAAEHGEPATWWNAYRCRTCRMFHAGHSHRRGNG